MWARRFSPEDIVKVENVGPCRFVVHILGLVVETQQTLKVIPGLRVTHELGWMAHNEMADATMRIAGLLQSAHARHCLVEIENAVDLQPATNYGGSGRLIVDEVIRGLLHGADVQPNLQWNQQKPRGAWPAFEQHSTVILATAPRGHQGTSGCPVPIQAGRRAGPEYCARKFV
ncbi:hypothetical protein MRX96_045034 [Rhipicephalus microplus]